MSLKDLSKEIRKELNAAEKRLDTKESANAFGVAVDGAVVATLYRVLRAVEEAEKNDG